MLHSEQGFARTCIAFNTSAAIRTVYRRAGAAISCGVVPVMILQRVARTFVHT